MLQAHHTIGKKNRIGFLCRIILAIAFVSSIWIRVMPARAQQTDASASISADWIAFRGDQQRTGARDETFGAIPNLIWRYTSTDDAQPLFASPLLAGIPGQARVYFAAGSKIYCIDAQSGAPIWITPAFTSTIVSPLLLQSGDNGDVLYCVTSAGDLFALDAVSGKTIKSVSLGATVQNVAPVPVVTDNGNRLIVGTVAGKLIAVDPQKMTVDPSWQISLGRFGGAVTSTPALTTDGKYLFVPAADENVYVVDVKKGAVYFPIHMRYGVVGSPAIAGNSVIVANGPLITCLNGANGQTRWAVSLNTLMQTSPAVFTNPDGSGAVYAGTSTGTFYALDFRNGKILWQDELGDSISASPTALRDLVLVGTQRGMLFGIDPLNGHVKWSYRVDTQRKVSTNTRFSNYSTTDQGGYSAENGATSNNNQNTNNSRTSNYLRNRFGDEVSVYPLSTSPTIAGGKIIVGGDNLAIYAFDNEAFDATPPLVQNLKPYVNNSDSVLQDVSDSRSISGKPPVVLKGQLVDAGSGVDPDSIKVLLNGKLLPANWHTFNEMTGDLQIYLTGIPGDSESALGDGRVAVEIQATDYAGNKVSGDENKITLRVDHNQAAPQATTTNNRYNSFGRGRRR